MIFKRWRKKAEGLNWRWRAIVCLFLVCAAQENVLLQYDKYIYSFGTIVMLLSLESVVT